MPGRLAGWNTSRAKQLFIALPRMLAEFTPGNPGLSLGHAVCIREGVLIVKSLSSGTCGGGSSGGVGNGGGGGGVSDYRCEVVAVVVTVVTDVTVVVGVVLW